jgi:glycosyltransferase involved in cell wall biosynthesis
MVSKDFRWEHDKNPEAFFEALHELVQENVPFEAVVIGQSFAEEPEVFEKVLTDVLLFSCYTYHTLKPIIILPHIVRCIHNSTLHLVQARPELERYGALVHWGYVEREQYDVLVASCDVVVSCALHEFFGISMLEAAVRGCYPLCPNRLAYPELFPEEHLYNTPRQLFKRLRSFCRAPESVRTWRSSADGGAKLDLERFRWEGALEQVYIDALALNTVTYTTPT